MRVLLLGARSQLGTDILRTWPQGSITPLGRAECDVTESASVRQAIDAHRPDLVVSCAASHRVDEVERNPDEALRVNGFGAWVVASEAALAGLPVMWVSTDYVFRGDGVCPYEEHHPVEPVSAYGATKASGERLVAIANPRHFIVRSSGLYGVAGSSGKGTNFVETMLRLAREGKPLRVVDDQVLSPTSTYDLAGAMSELAESGAYGIVHITNQGALSWHDFAALIFRLCDLKADLQPTSSAAYGAPALRPLYSVLSNARLLSLGIHSPRSIEAALTAYLKEKRHCAG